MMLVALLLLAATAVPPAPDALIGAVELPFAARDRLTPREAAAVERFLDGWNDAGRWAPSAPSTGVRLGPSGEIAAGRAVRTETPPRDRALAGLARAQRSGFAPAFTVEALRKLAAGEGQVAQDARALIRDLGTAAF